MAKVYLETLGRDCTCATHEGPHFLHHDRILRAQSNVLLGYVHDALTQAIELAERGRLDAEHIRDVEGRARGWMIAERARLQELRYHLGLRSWDIRTGDDLIWPPETIEIRDKGREIYRDCQELFGLLRSHGVNI